MDPAKQDLDALEQALALGAPRFESIDEYVSAAFPGAVARARSFLQTLGAKASQGAAPHLGLLLLSARGGQALEARAAALRVLREHPSEQERLRRLSEPQVAAAIRAAESIWLGELEVDRVRQGREGASLRESLFKLREIIEREPLCYRAQIEHQAICERALMFMPAQRLCADARRFAEPLPQLELLTARVALAELRLRDAAQLVIDAAARARDFSATEAALLRICEHYPEWRQQLRSEMKRLDAPRDALPTLRKWFDLLGDASVASAPRVDSRPPAGRISKWGSTLPPRAALAARDHLAGLTKADWRPDLVLRYVAVLCRLNERAAAERALSLLPDDDATPYGRHARTLVLGRDAPELTTATTRSAASPQPSSASTPTVSPPPKSKASAEDSGAKSKWAEVVAEVAVGVARGEHRSQWRELQGLLSVPVERTLVKALIDHAATSSGRARGITDVVEYRVRGHSHDTRLKMPIWDCRHALVYLHLLCGLAERSHNASDDRIARELAKAGAGSVAESLANQYLNPGDHGPSLWDALIELGDLGYRLQTEPNLKAGCALLHLARPTSLPEDGPQKICLLVVWEDVPPVIETVKERLAEQARAKESKPVLVAVFVGTAPLRLQKYKTEVANYAAAVAPLETLSGATLRTTLGLAQELAGTVRNPVRAFPFSGQELSTEQLIPRPDVVAALGLALAAEPRPLAIYCMRKSGKTATARLLNVDQPQQIIDLRSHASKLREQPEQLLRFLEGALPPQPNRAGLLVLDEFDFLARQLARLPEGFAIEFLTWLRDAAHASRILCLGLDPLAFRRLYPGSNPLQDLPDFRLRYFDRAESQNLVLRMAGELRLEQDLIEWLIENSGGHPGVLRGLMLWCIESRFGKHNERISTREPLGLDLVNHRELFSLAGGKARASALSTILDTAEDAQGVARDAWLILRHVAVHLAEPMPCLEALQLAAELDIGLQHDPSEGLDLLVSWGLLRSETPDSWRVSIPLLRLHLRNQQKLGPEPC